VGELPSPHSQRTFSSLQACWLNAPISRLSPLCKPAWLVSCNAPQIMRYSAQRHAARQDLHEYPCDSIHCVLFSSSVRIVLNPRALHAHHCLLIPCLSAHLSIPTVPFVDSRFREERVIVFAREIPKTKLHFSYADPVLVKPPLPFHNFSISDAVRNGQIGTYTCVFGTRVQGDEATSVATGALTVGFQTVTCAHPPKPERWAGQHVTLAVSGVLLPSNATFAWPPVAQAAHAMSQPRKSLCACLLMWHRTEFLLEWLLYHTAVHGLEKTFIYDNDNDPDVDDLKSAVLWLSRYFDVEYVPWHVHKTQLAYHGARVHTHTHAHTHTHTRARALA
jgi:hypothetical protein